VKVRPVIESIISSVAVRDGLSWIGALLLAACAAIDAFPAELDELAVQFFERYHPTAKA
jgi:hypothetical protein